MEEINSIDDLIGAKLTYSEFDMFKGDIFRIIEKEIDKRLSEQYVREIVREQVFNMFLEDLKKRSWR